MLLCIINTDDNAASLPFRPPAGIGKRHLRLLPASCRLLRVTAIGCPHGERFDWWSSGSTPSYAKFTGEPKMIATLGIFQIQPGLYEYQVRYNGQELFANAGFDSIE